MRKLCVAFALCIFCGCGEAEKPKVITPVDGIQQDIKIGNDLKKSIKESAGANSATEKELEKKK
jgi:hypothetical protein